MNTQLKNKWIALEVEYQNCLKEKFIQHNNSNEMPLPHPAISSKMTFCSDGVIIRKHKNPIFNGGISVSVFNKTIAEMKNSTEEKNSSHIGNSNKAVAEYELLELAEYNPIEIAERDFNEVLKGLLTY